MSADNPVKVVLIDDDPYMLALLTFQLSNLGFTDIVSFERAEDALAMLEADPAAVGLIFCDLQMPEMDGIQFIRRFALLRSPAALVLISSESERILQAAEKLALAHKVDILGILKKPVSPQQLQALALANGQLQHHASLQRGKRKSYGPAEVRRAITEGELVNYYQPQMEIGTGALIGVETLVRWQHPQDGLVFPDQFVGTAEEHGLIDDLTHVVLIEALRQARRWQDAGLQLLVSVNVSMKNLTVLRFPDFVAEETEKAGIPKTSLILEVTESQLMNNRRASLEILTRLQLKRIRLSIDDFGTGHSSLSQLRDIPFNELKIDRGFVHGACRYASLRAIFDACISMARQLEMRTVAEGVEDLADWEFLRSSGCDIAQGYFIAKPMSGAELIDWLPRWHARAHELLESAAALPTSAP